MLDHSMLTKVWVDAALDFEFKVIFKDIKVNIPLFFSCQINI